MRLIANNQPPVAPSCASSLVESEASADLDLSGGGLLGPLSSWEGSNVGSASST